MSELKKTGSETNIATSVDVSNAVSGVAHLAGTETFTGVKTFNNTIYVGDGSSTNMMLTNGDIRKMTNGTVKTYSFPASGGTLELQGHTHYNIASGATSVYTSGDGTASISATGYGESYVKVHFLDYDAYFGSNSEYRIYSSGDNIIFHGPYGSDKSFPRMITFYKTSGWPNIWYPSGWEPTGDPSYDQYPSNLTNVWFYDESYGGLISPDTSIIFNVTGWESDTPKFQDASGAVGYNYQSGYGSISGAPIRTTISTFKTIATVDQIPPAQVQSDWNQYDSSQKDYIKNKPSIPKIFYGTSTQTGGTVAKTAYISGFTLTTGVIVYIKFSYANVSPNPTLNINSTGAKPIYRYGTTADFHYIKANQQVMSWMQNEIVGFLYNGSAWMMLKPADASTSRQGITRLCSTYANTLDDSDNIAPTQRALYNAYNELNTNKAAVDHTHEASAITSGTLALARIPTGTTSSTVALGNHTHAASAITSGTLALARIPTGTTSSTVALGDHTHSNYVTTNTEQTISATKTFTSSISVSASNYKSTVSTIGVSNTQLSDGRSARLQYNGISLTDANANQYQLQYPTLTKNETIATLSDIPTIPENMVSTTYSDLVTLRSNNQLVPGTTYRITDYETTTSTTNTQSAGHAFDLLVVADDVNKLNENARAALHSGDTYFANCKLEAWRIKYCLDNDTTRFDWASSSGKGVIYEMEDENGNKCGYDFKNIQFKRYIISSITSTLLAGDTLTSLQNVYVNAYMSVASTMSAYGCTIAVGSDFQWCYTFNTSATDASDNSLTASSRMNIIDVYGQLSGTKLVRKLNNIVLRGACFSNTFDSGCYNITTKAVLSRTNIHNSCHDLVLGGGGYFQIGSYCHDFLIGGSGLTSAREWIIGPNCNNIVSGQRAFRCNIGANCTYISLSTYNMACNFGQGCDYIHFGSASGSKGYYQSIDIGSNNSHIYLNCTGTTSTSAYYQNVTIGKGVNTTSTWKTITDANTNQNYETTYQAENSLVIPV